MFFFFYLSCDHPYLHSYLSCFFFNDTATTEIYTLSLHDALPILGNLDCASTSITLTAAHHVVLAEDRKSTRLNSSHGYISYAVFCLKKKKIINRERRHSNKNNRHQKKNGSDKQI